MVGQMKISNYWQTLHQQKILKTFTCLLSLNYLVWRPASWKKPCLGLRFQSVIFTGWPTKSDRFFSLLFYFIHATFCLLVICGWLVLSVLFMSSFDFLFLSFPDSLEYNLYVSVVNRFSCQVLHSPRSYKFRFVC